MKELKPDAFWLNREKAVLLVVDVQEKLVPAMPPDAYRQTLANIRMLVEGSRILGIPVLATEQYSKGLGGTVPELEEARRSKVIEKMSFGCCGEGSFVHYLKDLDRPQVVVTGMEAHVCVYQTVLGLLDAGYQVHLVRDAICSRRKTDFLAAAENAARAGAVVTTSETALFQCLRTAAAPEFKAVSALIKAQNK